MFSLDALPGNSVTVQYYGSGVVKLIFPTQEVGTALGWKLSEVLMDGHKEKVEIDALRSDVPFVITIHELYQQSKLGTIWKIGDEIEWTVEGTILKLRKV